MSELRIARVRDHCREAVRRQLLAVHRLWRRMEHISGPNQSIWRSTMALTSTELLRELRELVAALDRRVPQVQRAGEADIARDAAALRRRAMGRIQELERDPSVATNVR